MITISIKEFQNNLTNPEHQGALLSLDIGKTRIGIAISDINLIIANPFETYIRRNLSKDIGYIGRLSLDNHIKGIVIGYPLQLDGTEGENCLNIRNFSNKLFKKTNLPIFLKDERMSTASATRALSESGMTRKKRHSLDDKTAAALILTDVLEMLRNSIN